MGRLDEADLLFDKIIGPVLKSPSIDNIHKISVLTNLGILYMEKKNFSEAENLLVNSVGICRRFLPEMHPMLSMCLEWLALLFEKQEKLPEAEKAFSEAFKVSKAFRGSKGSENIRLHLNRVRAKLGLDLEPER
jgi:tetratricopeptide (TPR) repeat protein